METNTSKGGVRMAVTNYYSLNGRIIAEDTSGARTDYLRDALGSVVATTDQNQNVTTTARYAAYGTPFETTGNYSNLRFGWCGSWGYRKTQRSGTGLPQSETYVRARHYSQTASRWTAADPLWPSQPAYAYQGAVQACDYFGTCADGGCGKAVTDWCNHLQAVVNDMTHNTVGGLYDKVKACLTAKPYNISVIDAKLKALLQCMLKGCPATSADQETQGRYDPKSARVPCYLCARSSTDPQLPQSCRHICEQNQMSYSAVPFDTGDWVPFSGTLYGGREYDDPGYKGCIKRSDYDDQKQCAADLTKQYPGCTSITVLCTNNVSNNDSFGPAYLHEMMHACGLDHANVLEEWHDYIIALTCCLCLANPAMGGSDRARLAKCKSLNQCYDPNTDKP
jgi:hypothetical protein